MVECWHQFMVKLVWLNQLVFTCNTSVVLNQENEWMDTNANFGMTFVAVVQLYDHGQTDTHTEPGAAVVLVGVPACRELRQDQRSPRLDGLILGSPGLTECYKCYFCIN